MSKILIVDDDDAMRGLLRTRLEGSYEIFDTGDSDRALGLAMEHKPDALLLDLMMPKLSGFDLCQSLHSLSYTSRTKIFIITGKEGGAVQEYCKNLGATGFFHKPVDFNALKRRLADELETQRPERRRQTRVRMRVSLKLLRHRHGWQALRRSHLHGKRECRRVSLQLRRISRHRHHS